MQQHTLLLLCTVILFFLNWLMFFNFIKKYNKDCKQITEIFQEQQNRIEALEKQLDNN